MDELMFNFATKEYVQARIAEAMSFASSGGGGGGGSIKSDSGEIILPSADANTVLTVSGLSFQPNALFVYGVTSTGKTCGGIKFAGFAGVLTKVYANDPPSVAVPDYNTSSLPTSLFNLDSVSPSVKVTMSSDGFTLGNAQTSRPFEAGVTYYWKAWRFE